MQGEELYVLVGSREVKRQLTRKLDQDRPRPDLAIDVPPEVLAAVQPVPALSMATMIAGMLWISFGLFQLLESAVELLIVFAAGAMAADGVAGANVDMDSAGPALLGLACIGFYLFARFSMAFALCRTGWKAVQRDNENLLAHALASILGSVFFLFPLWLILNGTWKQMPVPNAPALPFNTLPGMCIPIGLGLSSLLLIAAGVLIVGDKVRPLLLSDRWRTGVKQSQLEMVEREEE